MTWIAAPIGRRNDPRADPQARAGHGQVPGRPSVEDQVGRVVGHDGATLGRGPRATGFGGLEHLRRPPLPWRAGNAGSEGAQPPASLRQGTHGVWPHGVSWLACLLVSVRGCGLAVRGAYPKELRRGGAIPSWAPIAFSQSRATPFQPTSKGSEKLTRITRTECSPIAPVCTPATRVASPAMSSKPGGICTVPRYSYASPENKS